MTLTIARRLAIGFGVITFLLAVVSLLGINRMGGLHDSLEDITTDKWAKVTLLQDGLAGVNEITIAARDMAMLSSKDGQQAAKERLLAGRAAIGKAWEALRPLLTLPKGKELFALILESRQNYIAAQDEVIRLVEAGRQDEARAAIAGDFRRVAVEYRKRVNALIAFQGEMMNNSVQEAEAAYKTARALMVATVLVALLLAIVTAIWIIRSVTRPLGGEPEEVKAAVDKIAEGDLTAIVRVRSNDTDSLLATTRRMQDSLRSMVLELKTNADGVAAAAGQLASSSAQVATATTRQSEAASAMAAAVEEMTVSINHVSDSANEAHNVTVDVGTQSQAGSRVIQDTVAEMQEISRTVSEAAVTIERMGDSSQRISGIVQVIREVAEQTNLLALNAAIEAARAGEQGRGFAVVADEVRKLAERTAQATTEISAMINEVQSGAQAAVVTMQQAVARVESGVGLARKASESIVGISDGNQRVIAAMNDISGALKEQGAASNDIAVNVEEIAQMSEENNAATQEAAGTARHLEQLASATRAAVSRFRIS